jgi:hypothetical protein
VPSFRIREDARTWFKDLREKEKSFKVDFDAFYFCFIAGIAAQQKKMVPLDETAELVENFPDRYRERGKLLVALFLTRELAQLGVAMNEKLAVHTAISDFINPEAPNFLTEDGVKEFNKYAHGGFEVLLDWFEDRPRTIETFLRTFKHKLDIALSGQKLPSADESQNQ